MIFVTKKTTNTFRSFKTEVKIFVFYVFCLFFGKWNTIETQYNKWRDHVDVQKQKSYKE